MERLEQLNQDYEESLVALAAAESLVKHIQEERWQLRRQQLYFGDTDGTDA